MYIGKVEKGGPVMDTQEAMKEALGIIEKSRHCLLSTNVADGLPGVRVMSNRKYEGIKDIWFKTETSSRKVQQLEKDNRVCLCYLDNEMERELILEGYMEILQDLESKKMLWQEGDEKFSPQGVDDPGTTILHFRAVRGEYIDALQNHDVTFDIE